MGDCISRRPTENGLYTGDTYILHIDTVVIVSSNIYLFSSYTVTCTNTSLSCVSSFSRKTCCFCNYATVASVHSIYFINICQYYQRIYWNEEIKKSKYLHFPNPRLQTDSKTVRRNMICFDMPFSGVIYGQGIYNDMANVHVI